MLLKDVIAFFTSCNIVDVWNNLEILDALYYISFLHLDLIMVVVVPFLTVKIALSLLIIKRTSYTICRVGFA